MSRVLDGFETEIAEDGSVVFSVPNGEDYRLTPREAAELAYLILRAAEEASR